MTFHKRIVLAVICLISLLSTFTHVSADSVAGRDKAFTCTGCHSSPGYRNAYPGYTVPKLGGQKADYLEVALKAYRDGSRKHKTMHAQIAQLSDQDIFDIASYFSTLTQ